MRSPAQELTYRVVNSDDDIPAITKIAREAHDESRYRDIPFSEDKARKLVQGAFEDGAPQIVLLALKGGDPVGLAACTVGEFHIGTDVRIASINTIAVSRRVRNTLGGGRIALALIQGLHRWAKVQNAREVSLHVTSGVDLPRAHKLAIRLGYELTGGNYVANL
ncbi:GNAT family N-acetyltransferase (plasmid) [Phaeobacter sp. LSS9]|uniref:GNAT family N-acetyltransferase n=1 Tax=unclassified Phaeobacter TaxID=2621772 RepID=UPI000E503F74|nr:GNAT family N-acetyltransferase [Phaeobacter sp. LSS9]AXT37127.1 GNAT family N-acetyltransferase [Phaeobacter sp. LSS9]